MKRNPTLASNSTDGNRLLVNEVRFVEADIYVQFLGTSPFIQPETIWKGIERVASGSYDSAVLFNPQRQYTWDEKGPTYDVHNIPNSADLPETLIEAMGLYIVSRRTELENQCHIGKA